jgi:hypothetical protein
MVCDHHAMRDGETPPCFPEPEVPNVEEPGWGALDVPAWLGSSTLPAAQRAREFLNRSLDALPRDAAANLYRRLRDEPPFNRVFFELLVGRFLQVLGAKVDHQPAGLDGKNVDWRATFPTGQVVYVEATSPDYNRVARRERAHRAALLAIIEAELPPGWWIAPVRLPRSGLPQRAFRGAIRAMFANLPDGSGFSRANRLRLEAPTAHGPIAADFWPGNPTKSKIASALLGGGYDDSSLRVELAARHKRGQARAFPGEVVLLAIDAPFDGPDIESFDDALFGHMVVSIDPESLGVTDYSFRPDGALARQRDAEYAGVLAFSRVHLFGAGDPILYRHPGYTGSLPEALLSLRQRSLDGRIIRDVPPVRTRIADGIGFTSADDS